MGESRITLHWADRPATQLTRPDALPCYPEPVALPFDLKFSLPWAFLALPLLLTLPRKRTWVLRWLSLTALIVALAQPMIGRPSNDVVILVDVSSSVGDLGREAAGRFDLSVLQTEPQIFFFAGDSVSVNALDASVPGVLDRASTDLARALQVAGASGAQRILVVSDGAESNGEALLALPTAPVDILVIEGLPNARLMDLLAPDQAGAGETIEVVAIVESDQATRLTLRPEADGEPLEPITVAVPSGKSSIPFLLQVEGGGTVRISSAISVDYSQPTADDGLDIEVAVSDRDPVLVLGDPAMIRLLRTQGFEIVEGSVADVTTPLPFSGVVIRESAAQFTPGQLELLKSFVENGGGLMMTGGPSSFGFGSWYRTPVEKILPVNTDLRTEVDLPLVAMVIVLDRSQSMSTGNPSKIDLAKEGAISVVDLAYQEDLLGLIAFSDESSTEWIFELRPATERGKRVMLQSILGIGTRGGTVLRPAYQQALSALAQTPASVKHVIILSDGKLYDGQGPLADSQDADFTLLAAQGFGARITTSTIAIGGTADFARLEEIAQAGGGRYYQALNVNTLPQIFTNEALTATRSLLREEAFRPIGRQHPLSPISGVIPTLDAYVASTLKADAEVIIEGISDEPILAVRRQGLGRTAALTTDLNLWAGDFGTWDQLPSLLSTVVRWLQAGPTDFSASATHDGNRLHVVVDAVKNGEYINNRQLEVRHLGTERPLEQVAPGRYEGWLPLTGSGGTLLVIDGDEVVARTRISAPAPEFDTHGAAQRLHEIALRTGGTILTEPGPYAPTTRSATQGIWIYFALAGIILFLAELILRRFGRPAPTRPVSVGSPGRS